MMAAATAAAAYYASLEYVKERQQGRKISVKDPSTPQIPIVEHADVKRMLLFQRAVVDGSLGLLLMCSKLSDLDMVLEGEEKERNFLLLDLLTPVVKTYPSEMGILSVSQGIQCLGGYGYCDEFPLEQYFRDMRIHPIHEGTTGIQGMDMLGRKVVMKNGQAFQIYLEEVQKTIKRAEEFNGLQPVAKELTAALATLNDVTQYLTGLAAAGQIDEFLADATLYLEFFSIITVAWQWLVQGITAQEALNNGASGGDISFYQGKIYTMQYFYRYELPKIDGLAKILKNTGGLTVEIKPEFYFD